MASTFTSSKVAATVQPRAGLGVQSVSASYELTAALVVNDIIQMVKIPKGAYILDVILASDDIDSATAAVLAVGDDGSAARFITGSTIGQAGGVEHMNVETGLGYQYTANNTIDIKCTTAPGTGVVGTLMLTVIYTMDY